MYIEFTIQFGKDKYIPKARPMTEKDRKTIEKIDKKTWKGYEDMPLVTKTKGTPKWKSMKKPSGK